MGIKVERVLLIKKKLPNQEENFFEWLHPKQRIEFLKQLHVSPTTLACIGINGM